MKYGILGGFIKLAFAKTAFSYLETAIPELDMAAYRKRVLKEYRAIVERTPGIGSMKDNMFVMTMYCGAFAIALYKMADGKLDEEKLKGLIRALAYGDDECNFHLMSRARAEELGFVPGPDAK